MSFVVYHFDVRPRVCDGDSQSLYRQIYLLRAYMIKNATIKVGVKIRPSSQNRKPVSVDTVTGEVCIQLPSDQVQRVQVDMVHDASSTDKSIYETGHLQELIGKFVEGYNVAVLTYGQTGSGKTFAFEGSKDSPGIIFHAIKEIFSHRSSSTIFKCSFIQIYNERITDMLTPDLAGERGLKMRWEAEREFVIQDLTQRECRSAEQMIHEWEVGNKNRIVASNKINDYSSRSHSVFGIVMEDQDEQGNFRVRQAHFVDLAGSQRVFSPVGRLSKEAIEINKSLFFLRKVILALQEMSSNGKEQYIPYRDSKLTSILKRSFGGNCLTYLIACINPSPDYIDQTLATLQYAISARKIRNQVNVNIDLKARQIRELRGQKERLQKQLEAAMMQIDAFKSLEREEQVRRAANNQYANRIIQCIGTVRQLLKSNKALRAQLEQERIQKKRLAHDLEQSQKNLKAAKKVGFLSPIRQEKERKNTKTKTDLQQNQEKSPISQSVDVLRRKEKTNSVVRRKRFMLFDGSPRR